MSKLGDIAISTVGEERPQAIKIDDIIEKFGGVVTINGLSYSDYKGTRIPVFSFTEGEGLVFWGGCKKLRELAEAWEEAYGDLRTVNDELAVEGVKIKLSPTIKTKGGNPFRPVAILGTVNFDEVTESPNVDADTGEILEENEYDPF